MKKTHAPHDRQLALEFDATPDRAMAAANACLGSHFVVVEPAIASGNRCLLRAGDDAEAIEAWIAARCHDAGCAKAGRPAHTARSYRRDAQRFVLWLRIERGVDRLGQASVEDCVAFKQFLADPQPAARWCGPRGAPIGSGDWRPFAGPLSARSIRQSMTILCGMYRFLLEMRYLDANPWNAVAMPRGAEPRLETGRSLSHAQWAEVDRELESAPLDATSRQLAWAVRLLYATGLRLAEICSARCSDLRWAELDSIEHGSPGSDSACVGGWVLTVVGKGFRPRVVPVPTPLVVELKGRVPATVTAGNDWADVDQPLLVTRGNRLGDARPQSPQALYRQLKRLFARVASRAAAAGRARDAATFQRASTHWLRHTHCTHSIEAGVPVDVVRESAGHASLATTSLYVHPGLARRVKEGSRLASWAAG